MKHMDFDKSVRNKLQSLREPDVKEDEIQRVLKIIGHTPSHRKWYHFFANKYFLSAILLFVLTIIMLNWEEPTSTNKDQLDKNTVLSFTKSNDKSTQVHKQPKIEGIQNNKSIGFSTLNDQNEVDQDEKYSFNNDTISAQFVNKEKVKKQGSGFMQNSKSTKTKLELDSEKPSKSIGSPFLKMSKIKNQIKRSEGEILGKHSSEDIQINTHQHITNDVSNTIQNSNPLGSDKKTEVVQYTEKELVDAKAGRSVNVFAPLDFNWKLLTYKSSLADLHIIPNPITTSKWKLGVFAGISEKNYSTGLGFQYSIYKRWSVMSGIGMTMPQYYQFETPTDYFNKTKDEFYDEYDIDRNRKVTDIKIGERSFLVPIEIRYYQPIYGQFSAFMGVGANLKIHDNHQVSFENETGERESLSHVKTKDRSRLSGFSEIGISYPFRKFDFQLSGLISSYSDRGERRNDHFEFRPEMRLYIFRSL